MRRSPLRAFAGIFVVTLLSLIAVGAVLPVLPRYVRGPLDSGNFAVGLVIGAFAFTALAGRPLAGRLRRPARAAPGGRRRLAARVQLAGLLYFVPAGLPGLLARAARARGRRGHGVHGRRDLGRRPGAARPPGRVIGLYGLAVWSGLSLGPPIGDALLRASSFDAVWAFAADRPLPRGAGGAADPRPVPRPSQQRERAAPDRPRVAAARVRALAGHRRLRGDGLVHRPRPGRQRHRPRRHRLHRVRGHRRADPTHRRRSPRSDRPTSLRRRRGRDRGGRPGADRAGDEPSGRPAGAVGMGAAFALIYPSLSLVVVNSVPESRRGTALGTFTAFFDIGVGVGGPMAGLAAVSGRLFRPHSGSPRPARSAPSRWPMRSEEAGLAREHRHQSPSAPLTRPPRPA